MTDQTHIIMIIIIIIILLKVLVLRTRVLILSCQDIIIFNINNKTSLTLIWIHLFGTLLLASPSHQFIELKLGPFRLEYSISNPTLQAEPKLH